MLYTIPGGSRRILLAEDDPVIRHLATALIGQEGYEVVSVADGREAFRTLQSDADFKAAVFDMTMPHLEGLDLVRFMRTEKRLMRIPVLVVTAEKDIKLMAVSFAAGATAFLPKPFTPAQLRNALRLLLGNSAIDRRAA